MSLKLYFHPLSSFCQKALIALYENDTPFVPHMIDLADPADAALLKGIWPIRKFPVLRDESTNRVIPESSIIIEYLDSYYAGRTRFLPADADLAREARLRDRFFDMYVSLPIQKIVIDRLRPAGCGDALGVEQAKDQLRTSYDIIEADVAGKTWAIGASFSLADCAAAPALYYAEKVLPFVRSYPAMAEYFGRLMDRPSYKRALREAEPYLSMFPQ
jgi:glutathione S-transferase